MSSTNRPRTLLHLAALASVAVPGLDPVGTQEMPHQDSEIGAALVIDGLDRQWVIRAPRTTAAAARLDAEARFVDGVYGSVSFAVPRIAGTVALPEGGHAYLQRLVAGDPATGRRLESSAALAATVGRTLATIHDLPTRLVTAADLPAYEAEESRQRRLAEVDRAAATGKIPATLLSRWENAIEEVTAWRFIPCVVHGALDEDTVRVEGVTLSGILGWSRSHVGDPAEDFAWVAGSVSQGTLDAVVGAYTARRRATPDSDLARRARLYAELAVARSLLLALTADDEPAVADALTRLHTLNDTLASDSAW